MEQFIHLISEMAPYLLLGFFLAGLMHAFIPSNFYGKYLSANNFRSVVNAAIFGIPLPLCSCGVIPTAMSLRKEGASKGAVVSFLIATPQTGIDSIIATYGLMGLPFAIIRPIAALVTAIFGGAAVRDRKADSVVQDTEKEALDEASHKHHHETERGKSFGQRLLSALEYAFITMMEDIGKWLIIGLLVAALITIFVPTEWFAIFKGNTFASMFLVLCIAIPMYICATGSIPIAVALMMKGLTPGAALVLLMAGPACNIASMLVVQKSLGTRTLISYLLSIIIGAILFGCAVDFLQFHGMVDFLGQLSMSDVCCAENVGWFDYLCTAVLALLLINALLLNRLRGKKEHCCCEAEHQEKKCCEGESCCCNDSARSLNRYRIDGMSCNHCRTAVEKAISELQGVESVSVDLQTGIAEVKGDIEAGSVIRAVESLGYDCKSLE